MPAKKIIVIGELNVDLIFADKDIRPEPNREKLVREFRLALGSSSAITAAGLAGLGYDVAFVSIVGDDEFGAYCRKELVRLGVDAAHVLVDGSRRTGATLSISDGSDRSLLTYMGTIADVTPELVPEELLRDAAHVHFGSYFLQDGMRPHWAELFKRARQSSLTTSFDVGWDPEEQWDRERLAALLAWTDWFMPSEEEALRIFEAEDIAKLAASLPTSRGAVAVKRGGEGAALFLPDGRVVEGLPYSVEPLDTTGAGDNFNAGFIAAMLEGRSDADALRFANACGALSTLAIGGAGTVTREGVERFLNERITFPADAG